MKLSPGRLADFWQEAARPCRLVIVGAGRWGRVWADVATEAAGDASHIAIVARSNSEETAAWRAAAPQRSGLHVARSIAEAFAQLEGGRGEPLGAIVASRPRAHAKDAAACLELGASCLVEKPFSADPAEGAALLEQFRSATPKLFLGVEFSLHPAFHFVAERMPAPPRRVLLEWADPPTELRHGGVKRVHEEIGLLEDLLPHALSIFLIFADAAAVPELRLAELDRGRNAGHLEFATAGCTFELSAGVRGSRTRRLELALADGNVVRLDFASASPVITMAGTPLEPPSQLRRLNSTLRIELGAWLHALRLDEPGPLDANLSLYVEMHYRLLEILKAA